MQLLVATHGTSGLLADMHGGRGRGRGGAGRGGAGRGSSQARIDRTAEAKRIANERCQASARRAAGMRAAVQTPCEASSDTPMPVPSMIATPAVVAQGSPPARKRRFSGLDDDAMHVIVMKLVQAAPQHADGTSAAATDVNAVSSTSKRLRRAVEPMLEDLKAASPRAQWDELLVQGLIAPSGSPDMRAGIFGLENGRVIWCHMARSIQFAATRNEINTAITTFVSYNGIIDVVRFGSERLSVTKDLADTRGEDPPRQRLASAGDFLVAGNFKGALSSNLLLTRSAKCVIVAHWTGSRNGFSMTGVSEAARIVKMLACMNM